ncbi:Short-chain dehydrogenase TIC 32, chloroplastic [Daldinia childiae]|uniref:Short-chain dehydrogenase TIC 32, chloroplastic n=1 Tax=Daldinia childiae TaxID=326645 RepID=UPI001444E558|nr:Short-chain dehydrogenase TIC 32, chloroplastic [Daldinia childiae]KAF3066549.1 Short-chain dehydrogenase TIC 32, chloroplastic [Daldinia childiae]
MPAPVIEKEYNGRRVARKTATELARQYADLIEGKVILITGVSPMGLGAAFIDFIAPMRPATLILAGRSPSKMQQTADHVSAVSPDIKVRMVKLELESQAAVRYAAATVMEWSDVPHIDVLVNNAGVCAIPRAVTEDGFEKQFAVNHLGPFLFTNLIMPKLLESGAPRVVNIGSDGHNLSPIRFEDPNFRDESSYHTWIAYGQSKTANMLMALSLAEKLGPRYNLHAFSVNPGTVQTNLAAFLDWKRSFADLAKTSRLLGLAGGWKQDRDFQTIDEGTATYVYAAFDPEITAHNGAHLLGCRLADPWKDGIRAWATSPIEAELLWRMSEELVGQEFVY